MQTLISKGHLYTVVFPVIPIGASTVIRDYIFPNHETSHLLPSCCNCFRKHEKQDNSLKFAQYND